MAQSEGFNEKEVQAVRQALKTRPYWPTLSSELEKEATTQGSRNLQKLSLAFSYELVSPNQARRRQESGPYSLIYETALVRPEEVSDEQRRVWVAARESIDDPILESRISDLIYVAVGKSAHEEGRRGAKALAAVSQETSWESLDRAIAFCRSLEVLTELNDHSALSDVLVGAPTLVRALMTGEHPGPPITILRNIVALKPSLRPAELDDLMAEAIERFQTGHPAESVFELAASATNDQVKKKDLRRRHLQLLVDRAESADGLATVSFLQQAIDFAQRHGFPTQMRSLLKQQQDLPEENLGLQSFETSVEVPTDKVKEQINLVVGSHASDLSDALHRLGIFGPPGGSNADIDLEVENQQRESPLASLFSTHVFSPGSSTPTFLATEDESKKTMFRGRQRVIHTDFFGGVLYAPMIDDARDQHGTPDREGLCRVFATDLIGSDRAEAIARSIELFWNKDFDASAHTLVPRIESIMRDLARGSGVTIVKPAREGKFGGVISLNQIFEKLRDIQGPDPWFEYLEALLCDPLALNLRNDIAHGLIPKVGRGRAALLIQAACFLALLARESESGTA